MKNTLEDIFGTSQPIIGMIHLFGNSNKEKVDRAMEELHIYESEGINGAIIEDYAGAPIDVIDTLKTAQEKDLHIARGVNLLSNTYGAFDLSNRYGGSFVQLDSVQEKDIDISIYDNFRNSYASQYVLGGVRFKYTADSVNTLEHDILEGIQRADAIVTTGEGTGLETPLQKLIDFRKASDEFPLIVGAGLTKENISEQLRYANGAIIGSYFKQDGEITQVVDSKRVSRLMSIVRSI